MNKYIILFLSILISSKLHASPLYPWPSNWSLGGLSSWSMPLIKATDTIPVIGVASRGEMLVLIASLTIGSEAYIMVASDTWKRVTIPDATATQAGKIATWAQTFSGNKTFIGTTTVSGDMLATGVVRAGLYQSSDSSAGITATVDIPFIPEVSSITITIKGGIITGVVTP